MRKKPASFKRTSDRSYRIAKESSARDAIGIIEHGTDTFILTFGQFSLIDALVTILDQTGPADVTVCTWTAADANLQRAAGLLESTKMKSCRWIVDFSFESRQPEYCHHMRRLFGEDSIRAMRTHAKFILIRSDTHNIVIRTSMNMNENPRLESLEVTEDKRMAEFFQRLADEIFAEIEEGKRRSRMPLFDGLPDTISAPEVEYGIIGRDDTREARTTHTITRDGGGGNIANG